MNSKMMKTFVVGALSGAVLSAWAQHGSGGGAGKVNVHDISISKNANVLFAYEPGFKGGIRIAAGDINSAELGAMQKALVRGASGGTFTLTFNGQTTSPMIGHKSANNLKQIGLGAHSFKTMLIGFLRPKGANLEEYMTFKLSGVRFGPAGEGKKVEIHFVKSEKSARIGTANGGVWKTTDGVRG